MSPTELPLWKVFRGERAVGVLINAGRATAKGEKVASIKNDNDLKANNSNFVFPFVVVLLFPLWYGTVCLGKAN